MALEEIGGVGQVVGDVVFGDALQGLIAHGGLTSWKEKWAIIGRLFPLPLGVRGW
jgi:hypothetical protein